MHAHSFFLGGIPMLFYGDEVAYTNDYSYLDDEGKSYDNRWMHRPMINWQKNKRIDIPQSIENQVFSGTQKLLSIRKKLSQVADLKNLTWLRPHNPRVAGYVRTLGTKKLFCVFNFSNKLTPLTWYVFRELGDNPREVYDHWREKKYLVGKDYEHLLLEPYHFYLFEMEV
jgi:amylosucrase